MVSGYIGSKRRELKLNAKKIKYIGFYSDPIKDRVYNIAAVNKVNYISDSMVEAGFDVDIISASWVNSQEAKYEKLTTDKINSHKRVVYGPSFGATGKWSTYFKIIMHLLWLTKYLVMNTNKNDIILAYHVQWIAIPIWVSKLIKKFTFILEVEEVYGEVWSDSTKLQFLENILFKIADKYIFVSELLKDRFDVSKEEYLILYGSYLEIKNNYQRTHKDIIKLVYAGSIDPVKGGALNSVKIMEFLPDNYKLYILGHGKEEHINLLKNEIKRVNELRKKRVCNFEGIKHGEAYSNFLSQCDIALNPQRIGKYMNTAFPSKIISYLSHNLRVGTTEILSIKKSELANIIFFAKSDNPQELAKCILAINLQDDYNRTKVVEDLHKSFLGNLKIFLI